MKDFLEDDCELPIVDAEGRVPEIEPPNTWLLYNKVRPRLFKNVASFL
jgi:hypothetical protein